MVEIFASSVKVNGKEQVYKDTKQIPGREQVPASRVEKENKSPGKPGRPRLQAALRVLMITSEWPTDDKPYQVPFIVRQADFLRKAGVDLHVFPFRGGKQIRNYYHAWQQAQAEIARGEFDLVHAQWGQSGLLALPRRLPLVVTFRGDDLEGIIGPGGRQTMQGRVLQMISRLVARAADEVILVSESLTHALPHRAYHVIPSGIDLDMFRPAPQWETRQRLGLDLEKSYILFAGASGNPRKRFWLAQKAVDLLRGEMDVELLVAASVPHHRVPDYMNASDVLLLTSLHEGSPNVVKEALACNLPVVSTDVGDVCQRLSSIPGCAVLEDDRPEAIAAALREVISRDGTRSSVSRINGRQAILDLDENLLTQKVIDVYRQALSR